jgi:hypothetical protein
VPTEDGFDSDLPLPLFLSGHTDENKQQGSLLLLNAGILVMTATLVGIAITLSWGNPVKVFASVTASPTDFSARWPGTDQSTTKIQLPSDAQGSTPTATDAPVRGEIAAASAPANQSQTGNNEPPAEVLFGQFQAWAAKGNAWTQVEPVRPAQDARAQVLENAPAPAQPVQKHRNAKSAQNAQVEIRRVQSPRPKVQRDENARLGVRPAQDAQAPDQTAQNAQAQ